MISCVLVKQRFFLFQISTAVRVISDALLERSFRYRILAGHQKYAPIHSQPQWTQDGGVTLVRAVYWPWGSGAVAWFGVAAIALIVESCEFELLVGV